jgi:hypothetical protein
MGLEGRASAAPLQDVPDDSPIEMKRSRVELHYCLCGLKRNSQDRQQIQDLVGLVREGISSGGLYGSVFFDSENRNR